ncbi:MAG: hypothetical protein EBY16_01280 [Gammaproteobacteria bacterium]|nr:hypothetical protein [Gammaproteobacteria bacterium]
MFKRKLMLGFFSSMSLVASAFAAPKQLITHNYTDVESNAFINGVIGSQHPTKAHSDNKVFWPSVKLACYGHVSNNLCSALIKMKTDTDNPIDLAWVSVNLLTGEITPNEVSNNGYKLVVNGPGETSIYKE